MNMARNTVANPMIEPEIVTVSDIDYAIYPFPAFKAANLSGEIMALVLPIIGSLVPLFQKEGEILDTDIGEMAPEISGAFSSLSGDKVEKLLKALLTEHGNIATEIEDSEGKTKQVKLTEKIINDYGLFCGDIQDMYILAFNVLKVNYGGFFSKIGNLSGTQNVLTKVKQIYQDTEN